MVALKLRGIVTSADENLCQHVSTPLAHLLRSGELTATWAPNQEHEALRDLVGPRV